MSSPISGEYPGAGSSDCALEESVPLRLVQQGIAYIILYSTLSTLLFVLLCAVLMKDGLSPARRRTPVVWLLGLAMLLGVIGSALDTVFWATQMLRTTRSALQTASYYIASNAMLFIVPWVVRWAMCLRIASFYPVSLAGRRKRLAVVLLPSVLQVLNLVAFSIVLRDGFSDIERAGRANRGRLPTGTSGRLADRRLMVDLIAYGSALAGSLYLNAFLLHKYLQINRSAGTSTSPTLLAGPAPRKLSWASLQKLVLGFAFCYILPTLFLTAIIVVFCTAQGRALGFMLVCNVYVHVFAGTISCLSAWANMGHAGANSYYPKREGSGSGPSGGNGGCSACDASGGDASNGGGGGGHSRRASSMMQTASSALGLGRSRGNPAIAGRLRRYYDPATGGSKADGFFASHSDTNGGSSVGTNAHARAHAHAHADCGARYNDSDMLHAVETLGGGTLRNDMIDLPPGLPVSESKLLLHQRRRVSLALASLQRDAEYASALGMGSAGSEHGSLMNKSVSDKVGAWSNHAAAVAAATAPGKASSASTPDPLHIDLPPPALAGAAGVADGAALAKSASADGTASSRKRPPLQPAFSSLQLEISPRSLVPGQSADAALGRPPLQARDSDAGGEQLQQQQQQQQRGASMEYINEEIMRRRSSAISEERRSSEATLLNPGAPGAGL